MLLACPTNRGRIWRAPPAPSFFQPEMKFRSSSSYLFRTACRAAETKAAKGGTVVFGSGTKLPQWMPHPINNGETTRCQVTVASKWNRKRKKQNDVATMHSLSAPPRLLTGQLTNLEKHCSEMYPVHANLASLQYNHAEHQRSLSVPSELCLWLRSAELYML